MLLVSILLFSLSIFFYHSFFIIDFFFWEFYFKVRIQNFNLEIFILNFKDSYRFTFGNGWPFISPLSRTSPLHFSLNWHHIILKKDDDDCTFCFRHTILIFMWFGLVGVWSIFLLIKVLSLHKVSGQYIPEGFYECFETIVVDVMS